MNIILKSYEQTHIFTGDVEERLIQVDYNKQILPWRPFLCKEII